LYSATTTSGFFFFFGSSGAIWAMQFPLLLLAQQNSAWIPAAAFGSSEASLGISSTFRIARQPSWDRRQLSSSRSLGPLLLFFGS
jgi:hypothetical protein